MTGENQLPPQENPDDKLSTGLAILSFCIPIAGAIIYFSNKDKMPNKAKSACHAALWGFWNWNCFKHSWKTFRSELEDLRTINMDFVSVVVT